MGQNIHIIKPVEGINTDISEKYIKPTECRYILNMERLLNTGSDEQESTPPPGNIPLQAISVPGISTRITSHESKTTGEVYVLNYNNAGYHHIYRINRDNSIELVLMDPLLNFSIDPKYSAHARIHLFYNHNAFHEEQSKIFHKYLVWTEGKNWQYFLDVETAIATNGFRTPYFTTTDRTQLWQLPVRPPLLQPAGTFLASGETDLLLPNLIDNNVWQVRQKFIYTDGRPSAWSPWSHALVYHPACSVTKPRCMQFWFDLGGPQVERIIIGFRKCAGNFTQDQNPDLYETEIIEKYDKCGPIATPFYERGLNPDLVIDPLTNTFEFIFCAEGKCLPVDRTESDENFIDIPKRSFALMPMNNKLGLLNNVIGDDPISCDALKKIELGTIDPPPACPMEMVTIKVAVIIHNMLNESNQCIFIREDDNGDTEGLQKLFGGIQKERLSGNEWQDPAPYNQYFTDRGKDGGGFIAYIEGSDTFGITKQYRSNDLQTPFIARYFNDEDKRNEVGMAINGNNYYFISIAEIRVVRGQQGYIRLASHLTTGANDYRNTSTTVQGIHRDLRNYESNTAVIESDCNFYTTELYFNTCDGTEGGVLDLTNTPFIVCDLTGPKNGGFLGGSRRHTTGFYGYVRDNPTDDTEVPQPVPGADVDPKGFAHRTQWSWKTDHNGFYWATFENQDLDPGRRPCGVDFFVEGPSCVRTLGSGFQYSGGLLDHHKAYVEDVIIHAIPDYMDYIKTVNVHLEDTNGMPVEGVGVVIQGAKAEYTNVFGVATFHLRHDMLAGGLGYTAAYSVKAVVMPSGGCHLTAPDCNICLQSLTIPLENCFSITRPELDVWMPAVEAPPMERGWHPGGVYTVAIKLMDPAGRETFAEKIGTVTTPSMQQKNSFTFSQITWAVTGGMNLPRQYVKMAFLISRNKVFQDFVTWVADEVTYADGKIRLSVKSLYDSASLYAYATNVKYQFVPGDQVEFIANGDGKLFPDVITAIVESDINNRDVPPSDLLENETRHSDLVVSFRAELADLTKGCQIKLIRPYVCDPTEIYYETDIIDLVDGEPALQDGFITGFDTYFVYRGIHYDDMSNQFSFPFLHHSPSDFWGDHCIDRGRVSYENKYTKELQFGRKLRISAAFLDNSNYNGLAYYSKRLEKNFAGEQRGDITACVSREELFLVLCEYDNFIVNSANEFARVDQRSGNLVALPPDQVVSDAQSKISGNYGLQYEDVGTVVAGDGWAFYLDFYSKTPVLHDFQQGKNVAAHKMDDYFKKKLLYIAGHNRPLLPENRIRAVAGYDKVNNCVMLTFFDYLLNTFVHNHRGFQQPLNETIAFSLDDGTFPTTYSFTPEGYACFPHSLSGEVFLTFKNGQPWLHRDKSARFNEFYGTACDQVFEPVVNTDSKKVKMFLVIQQQSGMPWFCDAILTSLGHQSHLPPVFVTKITEGKWDAHFLRASNSKKGLYNGAELRGNWMRLRLVRDNSVNGAYGTVDPNKQRQYSKLDMMLVKFTFSEQSAYNMTAQSQ